MKKFLMFLCAVMMVFGMVGSASAVSFTNESFETGNFYGWDVESILGGAASVVTNDAGYSATHGNYFANLIATTLIGQSQSWLAGETLSFDWNFTTPELENTFWNDFSILLIKDSMDNVIANIKLADVISVGGAGSTGWNSYSYTFASANSGTISFGVSNYWGDDGDSQLYIDNVRPGAAPVPEPATILLLGSGLLGLVGYNRKRFSKKS